MSLNKVMLIGNVGKDPEVRYLDSSGNTKVASFTLATTERYKDRSGEMKEITEWHNIVAWRNSADVVERFVKKGTQLYVEGRIRTRSWDDQSGNKRYTTEIIADSLQLLGKKADNPASQGGFNNAPQGGYNNGNYNNGGYSNGGYNNNSSAGQYGQAPGFGPQQNMVSQPAGPQRPVENDDLPEDDLPF